MLAAGLGRRLAGATLLPKWLLPINGSCPADVQLQAFADGGIGRVYVVAPPDVAPFEEHLAPWHDQVDLELLINAHAAERNNWYSLLMGLDAWQLGSGDDVVVVNSDLFASAAWFTTLLSTIGRSGRSAALAIDRARGRTDEAMKVGLDPTGVAVEAIGKVGIARPGGEYVGMAWWSRAAAEELRSVLWSFLDDPASVDNWYEHGIQNHLDAGATYAVVDVPSGRWVEIDDEDDLAAARLLSDG